MTTGILIKSILKSITKAELARRMKTSWSTIRLWERGVYTPAPSSNLKLEAILKELQSEEKE